MSRLQRQQPGLLDLDARLRDIGANRPLLGDRLSERHARFDAAAHGFERALGHADQPHAMMNASRPKPALRDLKSAPFAEQHIRRGHATLSNVISPWPCGA